MSSVNCWDRTTAPASPWVKALPSRSRFCSRRLLIRSQSVRLSRSSDATAALTGSFRIQSESLGAWASAVVVRCWESRDLKSGAWLAATLAGTPISRSASSPVVASSTEGALKSICPAASVAPRFAKLSR